MGDFIIQHEPTVRMSFFIGTLLLVALWEFILPARELRVAKGWRWLNNLGITFLNSFLLRFVFPVLAAGFAVICAENGWGLLNQISLPGFLEILIAIVIQDLVIYGQHVLFHYVPIFWRFHKMHHADPDYDVTTGARFHPVEICLSMGLKLLTVFLLGPSALAVILFEIILSSMAMFNHANANLQTGLDRFVRAVVVTPNMHRVHHSVLPNEHHRNFGFNLSCWDRIFGTYKAAPEKSWSEMTIGLPAYQGKLRQNILWLITMPFQKEPED
ncbi:sterol desaturase family protein [Sneathiella limimaris]|uniref:sterol desaturase family protein n=1 Tax=Sneathiella limimaris TaxID=1964213 RepID=UPI0019D02E05|nr:sterol desaturase family protein [Sneathiella limimaris]